MRLPGIGSHHSATSETDEWLTPAWLLDAVGPFDLDPCANADYPDRCAPRYFTAKDDGLSEAWSGRVWLNPPYSNVEAWVDRLSLYDGGGVALVFARTETRWWFESIWPRASAVFFLRGRLTFHRGDGTPNRRSVHAGSGNAGAPSALVAYGDHDADLLRAAPLAGAYLRGPIDV